MNASLNGKLGHPNAWRADLGVYFRYIVMGWLVVILLATIQLDFLYEAPFRPRFLIIPSLVGMVAGFFIARQRILSDEVRAKNMTFASLVEMAEEAAYLQNLDRSYRYISSAITDMTGYDVKTFYQTPNLFADLVYEEDFPKWLSYEKSVAAGRTPDAIEVRLTTKHKGLIWVRHVTRPIFDGKKIIGYSSTNAEITDQVNQATAMKELALKDPLTGLPNRRHLSSEADRLLKKGSDFCLVMMDLDRFKTINDSLGHSVGDLMLKKVRDRLELIAPYGSLISRFGGDEFVVILPEVADEKKVEGLIESFLRAVERPMKLNGLNLHVSASFGWVFAPEDGRDVETLIRYADAAMHMAKQKQGVSCLRYAGHVDDHHQRLLLLENRLRKAVEERRIKPFYQPLFCARSGQLMGVECLARWHDEELGWVSPDEFIPLAETANLIGKLGDSILEHAIIVAQALHQNCDQKDVYFSVNASPYQLSEIGFVDNMKALLERHQLPPRLLKIEVTESLFIGGNLQAINVLTELRNLGVGVALDDFGTGYSAFAVLKEGCIDMLKVDKSFVQNIAENDQEKALMTEIIQMAHIMNLQVVAEGVETEEQKAVLVGAECDILQGYLLAKPMSEADFCPYMNCNGLKEERD